ncbi:MAG: chemotaxis protein CheX [Pirellulales bacterium]|nr:chemotaxis protein CheX [Pirellulales bacterium]
METAYDNLIEEIAINIFSTMLNLELCRDEPQADEEGELLLSAVQIAGQWMGTAVLAISPELARNCAATMLGIPARNADEADLCEVAAELVNMIGGNLKGTLPGPSYLSLPTIITGSDYGLHIHKAMLIEDVCLRSPVGPLRIRLYERITQPDGVAPSPSAA